MLDDPRDIINTYPMVAVCNNCGHRWVQRFEKGRKAVASTVRCPRCDIQGETFLLPYTPPHAHSD